MTTALTPEQRIAALEAELAKFAESECDKIMAMSEEQITALTRMQGSNPDDVAKICRMACDLALKDVAIQRLEAELAACKKDAERYRWLRDTNKERTDMTTGKGILWPNEVSSVWWGLPEDQWDFFSGCLRCADGPEFDTAIDAAMAAQEKV